MWGLLYTTHFHFTSLPTFAQMARKRVRNALKKAGAAGKKLIKKVANDPEVQALIRSTASQVKQQVIGGVRAGMSGMTGGRITGSGDYVLSRNIRGGGNVNFGNRTASSIVIEREEFVGAIVSSSTAKGATITKYRFNPGNYVVAPWGSAIALGYESWEPLQAFVLYKPTSGDALNSTDSSLGKVVLAAQYNTYARDWDSVIELENANDSVIAKPSQAMALGLECARNLRGAKTLYVSATDPNNSGKAFYDLCDFYAASVGCQGTSVRLGDLFVRYKIRLFNPIVRDSEVPEVFVGAQGTASGTGTPLMTTMTVVENVSTKLGGAVSVGSSTAITLTLRPLVGRARLSMDWRANGSSAARTAWTITPTCSALGVDKTSSIATDTSLVAAGAIYWSAAGTTTSQNNVGYWVIPTDVDSITLTWSGGTNAASDVLTLILNISPYESSDF